MAERPSSVIPDSVSAAGKAEEAVATLLSQLGAAEQPIDFVTPGLFARSAAKAVGGSIRHPFALAGATTRFVAGSLAATTAAMARALGAPVAGPVSPEPTDRRFAHRTWSDNAAYFLVQQLYLLQRSYLDEVITAASLSPADDQKARFALGFLADAASPTNTLIGNPTALQRAFETGGRSLARGARNMAHDLRHNGGWPSQVDASKFEVGHNMATTPGKVVFRSDLIEVIQYVPQTPKVFAVPLLFCPPWINKYYIMDLAPDRSLIDWAVKRGHTCFAISYRNPSDSSDDVGFEDYIEGGTLEAIGVVKSVTGSPHVNLLSVCLGGTLSAMAMSHLAQRGDESVNAATFINTHTDFTQPGVLGAFVDEGTVRGIERRMAKKGYLDAREMSRTFDAIRANDLIFNYVVNNWLLGEDPPAFDLLAWNDDSTRMPAKMHSRYLRSCYLGNEFARGEFLFDGEALDPSVVENDTYVIGASGDHIVPWTSAYRTTQVLGGRSRFVLANGGHIAGIVNPPGPKARHWVGRTTPPTPDAWLEQAEQRTATWWEDWSAWMARRAGRKVAAPRASVAARTDRCTTRRGSTCGRGSAPSVC